MNRPQQKIDGSEPFNIPNLNSFLYDLNQEEGFCITRSPNNLSIGNPVNCVREMHEAERARAQNAPIINLTQSPDNSSIGNPVNCVQEMHEVERATAQNAPIIDLTQLPDYPLMTRNVVEETFPTHTHPALININNVNIGPTHSNNSRIPQTSTRFISEEGNAYNRFSPSLIQWNGMLGTDVQQIGNNMMALGANMNSAYQIPAQQEPITRTAGTKLGPHSSTSISMHGPQIRRNVYMNGVNMNSTDQNHGQQEQTVGIGGPNFMPSLLPARSGHRPQFGKSMLMVGASMNSGYQNVDQELMLRTGISDFSPTSTGSQSDRNMVTSGANKNLSYQNHDQKEQRASNQVMVAVSSNNPTCHPTLEFGDDKLSTCLSGRGTPSNDVIANNSSYSILGTQGDRNHLPLGKKIGDPNLLNNALNPTGGTNMFSLSTVQAPKVDLQHCYPIQGGRIPGSRINSSRKFVPIQAGLIANEQARPAVIGRMSRSATESPNFVPAPVYHTHMGNILSSNSKVFPSLGSTSGSGQTGQPVDIRFLHAQQATGGALCVPLTGKRSPVEGNMSQSVKLPRRSSAAGLPVPMLNRKTVTADPTTNKRVTKPVSVANLAKPVPVAIERVAKPVPMAIEKVAKQVPLLNKKAVNPVPVKPSGNVNPASAITKSPLVPRAELARLLSSLPSHEHIRWEDPDKSNHTIEENCGICKRNLVYAAKGAYVQPSLPPATAVLPCGHAYHDECLEGVTPLEQAKEPPCISCWISDSENC
ncbi:hypothetical protein C5167_032882 [Papaver somniferum]|uniref:RING-type domain-containing protein n=1 Tax=Papaver somniferum TaxID=3469 RepID=A0A4Y7KBN1_PAPSO|nr:uncharacterized protein LOC113297838 [Papaver somniferum]RZC69752.1 hypothetical protein C5167_032882 [Papaver somniferum]